jgi:PTS hybrid protein
MANEPARVGVVFVSHSAKIAEGLVDLAGQMAQGVALVAAGGSDDGGIGTSLQRIQAAISDADAGAGVVVLADLGSAVMTTESAIEFLDADHAERVRLADAPLVEGGVSAAVAAASGGDVAAVLAAAESAAESQAAGRAPEDLGMAAGVVGSGFGPGAVEADARSDGADGVGNGVLANTDGRADAGQASAPRVTRAVTLTNADGLHARPAAEFVKLANTFGARVTVNGRDAKSLLGIMSLGLTRGMSAEIASDEPGGEAAVDALAALVESGFVDGAASARE